MSSVSFEKHQNEIIAAWKDVVNDGTDTNWALYSYEGQTNELKVIGTGSGGVDELRDELNSSKIMYAYVRVENEATGINKFVLINWQGDGAPVLRKGTCANHIRSVSQLLKGAHLTINARNEDDLDLERLSFSSNIPQVPIHHHNNAAGSVSQVVGNARGSIGSDVNVGIKRDVKPVAMEKFWKKEQEEQKKRVEAERETKRQEFLKREQEQRVREEKEYQEREKMIASTSKLQPAHVPIKTSPQPLSPEKTVASFNTGMTEAERMRQMRKQEARELIGSRVGAAKAIFTQGTTESQINSKLNTAPPTKPVRNSIFQQQQQVEKPNINSYSNKSNNNSNNNNNVPIITKIDEFEQENQMIAAATTTTATATTTNAHTDEAIGGTSVADGNGGTVTVAAIAAAFANNLDEPPVKAEISAIADNIDDIQNVDDYANVEPEEQYSTIKRSPHSKSHSLQSPDTSSSNATDTAIYQDEEEEIRTKVSVTVQQSQSAKNGTATLLDRNGFGGLVNEDDFICQDEFVDLGLRARALYDYQAADGSEITFDPGDIITHIDQIDEGWWQGLGPDGTYGLFPANYVEIIN